MCRQTDMAAVVAQHGDTAPSMAQEILTAHNRFRAEVGVPPLEWSDVLTNHAQKYANYLAATNSFQHSGTKVEGENLWMGTSGFFSFTQMIRAFGSEKQFYKSGAFPNISNTGKWEDAGHYTQLVWRDTTDVGCAGTDDGHGLYRLVCRYSPPGNVMGQPVF
jgi:hypothetical protein